MNWRITKFRLLLRIASSGHRRQNDELQRQATHIAFIDNTKYIRMEVYKEAISVTILNLVGKMVMESVMGIKAFTILENVPRVRWR